MRINIDLIKKYHPIPALKKCVECPKFKPKYLLEKDVVQISKKTDENLKDVKIKLYNPWAEDTFQGAIKIDLSERSVIKLKNPKNLNESWLDLDYNPDNTGIIYKKSVDKLTKKVVKKPFEVNILKCTDNKWKTVYHFMSKDLKNQAGYVEIGNIRLLKNHSPSFFEYYRGEGMLENFPEIGLTGERITVEYLKNMNEKKYSGIGKLADRICVEHCIKNGIKPNIISVADNTGEQSPHVAHYLRGKRFLPLQEGSYSEDFFFEKYGEKDVNKVIENLLKNAKDGEKIDLQEWGEVRMYLPKDKVKEYTKQHKENPILK